MKGTENRKDSAREDVLEALFRHAAARERPPAGDEQAIRESLHGQWQQMTGTRRRRKQYVVFATAASLVLAVLAVALVNRGAKVETPGLEVATVELLRGQAYLQRETDNASTGIGRSAVLETGQSVSTAHGAGLAVRWQNGIVLRLDQNSRARIVSPRRLELKAGRIYIDTRDLEDSKDVLNLATPAGPVRHVGTRFMVAVNLGATSVSVREGRVLFGKGGEVATAGERLIAGADGRQRRETIPVHGEAWAWAEKLAVPDSTDGRSAAELLDWIGRETGRAVEYRSDAARRLAVETRLHGDIGVDPSQALQLLSRSTDLAVEIVDGSIVVRLDPAD